MSHLANVITSNRILGALRADDLDFMHPHLEPVPLRHGDALVLPDRQIEFVYFIEKGLASTIAESPPNAPVEIGMAGCEGLVGIPIVLGSDRAPYRVVVQGPGEALRVAAQDLRRIVVARPGVQECLLLYVQAFLVQVSLTADRYYVSQAVLQGKPERGSIARVPAPEIEALVISAMRSATATNPELSDGDLILNHLNRVTLHEGRIEIAINGEDEAPINLPWSRQSPQRRREILVPQSIRIMKGWSYRISGMKPIYASEEVLATV